MAERAEKAAVVAHAKPLVAQAPDIRADKVAEFRARINDPSFINDEVLSKTSDALLDAWFGGK
jgi:negative regulator of flagellin synthesis FlgM